MPDDEFDPGANTQKFQAFMARSEPEASGARLWVAVALAALVVALAVAWFVLTG